VHTQKSIQLILLFFLPAVSDGVIVSDFRDCPSCKKPRQARKKLDLWRLPEILVVHLKRFSYSRYIRNKLETYVDFPIDDFDLSTYTSKKDSQFSNHYVLYAISNHHGGMGCGHYDAFIDVSGVHSIYSFSFIAFG
jgi:ubiquitin carboxyl-terminal hydrolase 4/11/15